MPGAVRLAGLVQHRMRPYPPHSSPPCPAGADEQPPPPHYYLAGNFPDTMDWRGVQATPPPGEQHFTAHTAATHPQQQQPPHASHPFSAPWAAVAGSPHLPAAAATSTPAHWAFAPPFTAAATAQTGSAAACQPSNTGVAFGGVGGPGYGGHNQQQQQHDYMNAWSTQQHDYMNEWSTHPAAAVKRRAQPMEDNELPAAKRLASDLSRFRLSDDGAVAASTADVPHGANQWQQKYAAATEEDAAATPFMFTPEVVYSAFTNHTDQHHSHVMLPVRKTSSKAASFRAPKRHAGIPPTTTTTAAAAVHMDAAVDSYGGESAFFRCDGGGDGDVDVVRHEYGGGGSVDSSSGATGSCNNDNDDDDDSDGSDTPEFVVVPRLRQSLRASGTGGGGGGATDAGNCLPPHIYQEVKRSMEHAVRGNEIVLYSPPPPRLMAPRGGVGEAEKQQRFMREQTRHQANTRWQEGYATSLLPPSPPPQHHGGASFHGGNDDDDDDDDDGVVITEILDDDDDASMDWRS